MSQCEKCGDTIWVMCHNCDYGDRPAEPKCERCGGKGMIQIHPEADIPCPDCPPTTEPKCSCVGTIDPNCPRGHGRATEPAESEGKCMRCGELVSRHVNGICYPTSKASTYPATTEPAEREGKVCKCLYWARTAGQMHLPHHPRCPAAPPALEDAKAFPLPENERDFIVRTMERLNELQYRQMARFAEHYAAKRIDKFIVEVEKEASENPYIDELVLEAILNDCKGKL